MDPASWPSGAAGLSPPARTVARGMQRCCSRLVVFFSSQLAARSFLVGGGCGAVLPVLVLLAVGLALDHGSTVVGLGRGGQIDDLPSSDLPIS